MSFSKGIFVVQKTKLQQYKPCSVNATSSVRLREGIAGFMKMNFGLLEFKFCKLVFEQSIV